MTVDPRSEHDLDAQRVLSFVCDASSRPASFKTLASELQVDEAAEPQLRSILEDLLQAGSLVQTREHRFGCPAKMNLVVGTLKVHADGFGFVVPAPGSESADLFVAGRNLGNAMHGDRVIARREHQRRSGRTEGRVIRILQRARQRLVGKLEHSGGPAYVTPLDRRFVDDVHIPADAIGDAADGQLVEVEITAYPRANRGPVGRVIEVLGTAGDPSLDVEIVIREYQLASVFPDQVLKEAAVVATEVSEEQIEGRTDFRNLPIVTIDGSSAKDFDDAVYVELLPNGNYRLHVHIADVAFYIAAGSAIDTEARARATSVYFPDRVLPMLPESLSNEICSLKPGVDRLVHSLLIDIDRDGRTVNYEFHDGVIHSAARMTYGQVAAMLEPDEEMVAKFDEHSRQLERMKDLAMVLKEYRRGRGSIDFDLPEPEIVINLRGETEDIVKAERNIAHRIIEEFMIRANEVVASHFTWEDVKALYRVHEGPDPERIEQFREFISGLGHTLGGGDRPQPRHFVELLERLEGRPEEKVIATLMLRAMKQARYQVRNQGHFGLASHRYTHFTSPIRRYPDLVVHRLLKADRQSDKAASFDPVELTAALESIASACSTQERQAEKAEREYCGWKKVQFMADKLGEVYEGHITGVRSFGLFVELEPIFVEGLVPVSSLNDDYYIYDEAKHSLRGRSTGRTLTLGDRVKVQVAKVDLERHRLDFSLQEGPLERPAPSPAVAPRRRRRRSRHGEGRQRPAVAGRLNESHAASGRELPETGATASAEGEGLEPATAQTSVDEQQDASRPESSEPRARRRRGRRGGRRRSAAGASGGAARSGDASAAEPERRDTSKAEPERRDTSKAEPERRDTSKAESGSARSSERDSTRGGRPASKGRQGRGRPRSGRPGGRGRGMRPAVEVKPAPVRQPDRKQDEKEAEPPKINPYLTEIDF